MRQKKYLPIIITGTLLFSQAVFAADLKQLAEQLVNLSIQPFETKVYSETSKGARFTSCNEAKAWNEKITALEKEGIALKKEMERRRDESVLQVGKSQRVEFLDNFNQTIFPRLNRSLSTLKEVPLDYYCNNKNKKEDVDKCGDGLDNDCDGVSKSDEERTGRNPQIGKEVAVNTVKDKNIDIDLANALKDDGRNINNEQSDYNELRVPFDDMSDENALGHETKSIVCKYEDGANPQEECPPKVSPKDCPDCLYEPKPVKNMMGSTETPHMGLREGGEDPIPGIDVIVEKDPSVMSVHFDGSACLDCGEEPVRLSDKTVEILKKALPIIQKEGWKLELKKVDTEKYPKGTQAPAIPVKKVEKKKLFGLFGVEIETQAEINPQGEIQNIDKPWWSVFAW